ncbi:MAG TPA: aspartyl protease family protein, partial [Pyrinomonadaceae bacterium]|nr:aspartyl protease family protein [Pyrinomonadaceae bacterium]
KPDSPKYRENFDSRAFKWLSTDDVEPASKADVKQLIKQADKLVKRGNLAEAEQILKKAIEIEPKNSLARLKLALIYVKLRRLQSAYDLAFPIARDEPKNSFAFAVLGMTLLGAGRFSDARLVLVNSVKLDRSESLAWAGLGLLEFYENNLDEAYLNLQEAVYYDPMEPDYFYALAQVSARSEKYKEAAAAYEDFLRVSRNEDDERRARIKGLINFLRYLGNKSSLYNTGGADKTNIKFDLEGNRPVIKVFINDKPNPLRFVLDTGSGITVISDETAEALKIKPVTKGGFAKGIGGDGRFEIVYGFLREVKIGDVVVRSVPVYIRKFHSDGNINGYIGLGLISKFLTTIDYGNQTFSLKKREEEPAQPAMEGVTIPLRLTSSGFLSGEVHLEGFDSPLNFIVDTGASVSVISDDIASHDALQPFALNEKLRVIGSAGITDDVPTYLLPKITFGKHTRSKITAIALDLDLINEASGFQQSGILGGNFLKNYRMTFDFKNSRLTFSAIEPEPEK